MQQKDNKSVLWQRRRVQYRESGLSRRAFCKEHHLKLSTLDYWFCRLGKQEREHGLVELDRTSIVLQEPCLIVRISQNCRIEVRKGFDPQLLAEVIQALGVVQ